MARSARALGRESAGGHGNARQLPRALAAHRRLVEPEPGGGFDPAVHQPEDAGPRTEGVSRRSHEVVSGPARANANDCISNALMS